MKQLTDFIEDYGHKHLFEQGIFLALPCKCGQDCSGWVAVNNNEISLKSHIDLYHKYMPISTNN
jgi:hypothetical protein